ncbi:hypothetical protein R1sor_027386 [Riccia sorocarpa]|uniref:Sodium/metabolite cotransporter BASS3, chloroplastic n=1 Tax=Riccia sorocarpa TaxID=122646 RepID=A0ABD3GES9_9MARC
MANGIMPKCSSRFLCPPTSCALASCSSSVNVPSVRGAKGLPSLCLSRGSGSPVSRDECEASCFSKKGAGPGGLSFSSSNVLRNCGDASTSSSSSHCLSYFPNSALPFPSTRDARARWRYGVLRIVSMAQQKGRVGRVGKFRREGNVSLASFGIKTKKNRHGQPIDITKSLSKMLPFVVAATAVAALTKPASFAWVSKDYYAPALGGIMLSIGIQLSVSDFALVVKRPVPVLVGYAAQYLMKPLLGFLTVKMFNVPAAFAAGLVLTSCVAGAQLSSYASFLSEGDVALSIVLTSLTTITSVAITPLLTRILIGSVVPVNVVAMASSILQVVIGPVFLGLALNTYAKPLVDRVRNFMPLLAMVCTSLCIGSPLALNRSMIVSAQGLQLMLPILFFHTAAFTIGYWICQVSHWRQEDKVSRTISLCSGMQSSTLAMLLASQFLGMSHAVPPACSVVVMALMGLSVGSFWGKGFRIKDVIPSVVLSEEQRLKWT